MSKQSEIKEGLIQITKSKPMVYQLLRFLADNNCVIKVDKLLPENPYPDSVISMGYDKWMAYHQAQVDMSGYVAVEPLIEEK